LRLLEQPVREIREPTVTDASRRFFIPPW